MNLSDILENFEISADEISAQYGIFGPISNISNWDCAKTRVEVKAFMAICFDGALDGNMDIFVKGVVFIVDKVELYLANSEIQEFKVWVTILSEYRDCISYVLGAFEDKFEIELDKDSRNVIAVLLWIINNIDSIKTR
jgi:hypothetical protein